ncbi:MAG: bile acid:sodium symporter [Pseudomonadota bacterium]
MNALDSVSLNFSPSALVVLNVLLAYVVFGIALDLRWQDFRVVLRFPRALVVGLFAQFILLPAMTLALLLLLQPPAGLALGLIVVAACPGGSISNFFAARAGANVALSVSMSALSSLTAFVVTPLSIAIWGSGYAPARNLLHAVSVDFWQMLTIVLAVLIVPTLLGSLVATQRPATAERLRLPLRRSSTAIFLLFVAAAFIANGTLFLRHFDQVLALVVVHNLAALALGFLFASLAGLALRERKTICIEVGIQNTALGLTLIFTFFDGLGSMALVAGMWGVWHLLSGFAVAWFFQRKRVPAKV